MTKIKNIMHTWSELELLTGVIYGEARGESLDGQILVGLTVMERARHPGFWNWGRNPREVMLVKNQFECMDITKSQYPKIVHAKENNTAQWRKIKHLAACIYMGLFDDYVMIKPTHYHSYAVKPKWAKQFKFILQEGKHLFYTCFDKGGVL